MHAQMDAWRAYKQNASDTILTMVDAHNKPKTTQNIFRFFKNVTTDNITSLSNKHAYTKQQKQPKTYYQYLNITCSTVVLQCYR